MANKIFICSQHHLPRRPRNGKRTDELPLFLCQLCHCQFGNKGNPLPAFHHSHKRFHTSQPISHLADFHRFHLAKTNKLVTETMPFIQKPETFARYIGSTDYFMLERRFFAGYISIELLIKKSFFGQK